MIKKMTIIIFFIIVLVVIFGYYIYPRRGTLNDFLFNNYNKENIEKIEIRSTISREDESIKDKDKINEILSKLSNTKLVQHYGSDSDRTKGSYHIYIYDKYDIPIEIIIKGKEYISIINDSDKSKKEYKIVDDSLDINYINELINSNL